MKYKVWWFTAGISILCITFGIMNHSSDIDLQNQYTRIKSKMTEAEQIYSIQGLNQLKTGTYILFGAAILMMIMSVVGYLWFDREHKQPNVVENKQ